MKKINNFKDYFINEKEIKKYQPKSNSELKELVKDLNIHLGDIDVSKIDDFSEVFVRDKRKNFDGLETWDMSKAKNLARMFAWCENFNHNINNWDVSNVTKMDSLFEGCDKFNQPLDKWNVSKVRTMEYIFGGCENFNQPLNSWNVSNCDSFQGSFHNCKKFNQPLNNWKLGKVFCTSKMFYGTKSFNQNLSMWDSSEWSSYRHMFYNSGCELKNQPYLRAYYWRGFKEPANKTIPATEKQIKYAEFLSKVTKIDLPKDYKNDKDGLTKWISDASMRKDQLDAERRSKIVYFNQGRRK